MKETWYEIEGYDRYKVSNMGRVVDLKHKKILEPILLDNRHCFVTLNKNNRSKVFKLSVLVMKYVLGINKDTYYIMYKDKNPYNCSADNIYEIHYSYRARKRLDKKEVEDIYLATKHMKVKLIAEIHDLPIHTIYGIKNKKSYKDVTDFVDLYEAMKEGYIPDLLKF